MTHGETLYELSRVSQKEDHVSRRWFLSDFFELIVWYADDVITGFQLCYDRQKNEKALTWTAAGGFRHDTVDDGHVSDGIHMSAILIEDGEIPFSMLLNRFSSESRTIDGEIAEFVMEKLKSA